MTDIARIIALIRAGDARVTGVVQRNRQQLRESIARLKGDAEAFARAHGTAPKRLSTRNVEDTE